MSFIHCWRLRKEPIVIVITRGIDKPCGGGGIGDDSTGRGVGVFVGVFGMGSENHGHAHASICQISFEQQNSKLVIMVVTCTDQH